MRAALPTLLPEAKRQTPGMSDAWLQFLTGKWLTGSRCQEACTAGDEFVFVTKTSANIFLEVCCSPICRGTARWLRTCERPDPSKCLDNDYCVQMKSMFGCFSMAQNHWQEVCGGRYFFSNCGTKTDELFCSSRRKTHPRLSGVFVNYMNIDTACVTPGHFITNAKMSTLAALLSKMTLTRLLVFRIDLRNLEVLHSRDMYNAKAVPFGFIWFRSNHSLSCSSYAGRTFQTQTQGSASTPD